MHGACGGALVVDEGCASRCKVAVAVERTGAGGAATHCLSASPGPCMPISSITRRVRSVAASCRWRTCVYTHHHPPGPHAHTPLGVVSTHARAQSRHREGELREGLQVVSWAL